MSQKKVDAYKAEKKNRKANAIKEKKQKKFRSILVWVILGAVIAGLVVALVFTFRGAATTATDPFQASQFLLQDYGDVQGTYVEPTEAPTEAPTEGTQAAN
ncbi:MAG: hypothetical protein J5794_09360 [Lachnospiraceae bacterium]|nr:hypothetical protein [Lachnospiraceae bacterium]